MIIVALRGINHSSRITPFMTTKTLTIIYWISTVLIILIMGFFAYGQIAQNNPHFLEEMALFGFPLPFLKALGFSKILGIVALLVPGFPRIREWAYAGFAFTLLGAAFAHIDAGMYITPHWIFLAILLTSYFSWHKLNKNFKAH
ncbi:hypothetical protein BH09BAC1_BH09BAC1_30760 [soil metagenome]